MNTFVSPALLSSLNVKVAVFNRSLSWTVSAGPLQPVRGWQTVHDRLRPELCRFLQGEVCRLCPSPVRLLPQVVVYLGSSNVCGSPLKFQVTEGVREGVAGDRQLELVAAGLGEKLHITARWGLRK